MQCTHDAHHTHCIVCTLPVHTVHTHTGALNVKALTHDSTNFMGKLLPVCVCMGMVCVCVCVCMCMVCMCMVCDGVYGVYVYVCIYIYIYHYIYLCKYV